MRVRRSASSPMSETKSFTVSRSMPSVWRMESVSRRMEARGVLSSWEASETKRRRTSSVVWSRSVSWLNSPASWLSSSPPRMSTRWLYSPSRTMRMARSRSAMRRVSILEKTTLMMSTTTQMTREMERRFPWMSVRSRAWSASRS